MELGNLGGHFDSIPIKSPMDIGVCEMSLLGNLSRLFDQINPPLAWGNKLYYLANTSSSSNALYNKAFVYNMDTGEGVFKSPFPYIGIFNDFPGSKEGRFHYCTGYFWKETDSTMIYKIDLESSTYTTITNAPADMLRWSNRACWGEDALYYVKTSTRNSSIGSYNKVLIFNVFKYYPNTGINTQIDAFEYDATFKSSDHVAALTYAGDNEFYMTIKSQSSTMDDQYPIYIMKYDTKTLSRTVIGSCTKPKQLFDDAFQQEQLNLQRSYWSFLKDNKIYYRSIHWFNQGSDRRLIWSVYDISDNTYTTLKGTYNAVFPFGVISTKDYMVSTCRGNYGSAESGPLILL